MVLCGINSFFTNLFVAKIAKEMPSLTSILKGNNGTSCRGSQNDEISRRNNRAYTRVRHLCQEVVHKKVFGCSVFPFEKLKRCILCWYCAIAQKARARCTRGRTPSQALGVDSHIPATI